VSSTQGDDRERNAKQCIAAKKKSRHWIAQLVGEIGIPLVCAVVASELCSTQLVGNVDVLLAVSDVDIGDVVAECLSCTL